MNYLKLAIISLILTTILICILNPKVHKRVIVGNFSPVFEQESNTAPSVNQTNISTQQNTEKQTAKSTQTRQNINNNEPQRTQTKPFEPFKKGAKQISTQTKASKLQVVNEPPKPQAVSRSKGQLTPEEEEIIAWNLWRSNLQNKVMRDTKLAAPIGTVFRFSFTVDREGNISNLKVWSDNSDYTPMAVRTIKPAILSYQGQKILDFPPQSKRVITNVNGKFTVWYKSGYSSPSDYSDYERIKK